MNFDGHELIKINTVWVFDCTTYIGYKVKTSRKTGLVTEYNKAFKVKTAGGKNSYTKYVSDIPNGVLRKTEIIIEAHSKGNINTVIKSKT